MCYDIRKISVDHKLAILILSILANNNSIEKEKIFPKLIAETRMIHPRYLRCSKVLEFWLLAIAAKQLGDF